MKSIIIQNDSIHKQLKILAAQLDRTITEVVEEAILDAIEKYRILNENEEV